MTQQFVVLTDIPYEGWNPPHGVFSTLTQVIEWIETQPGPWYEWDILMYTVDHPEIESVWVDASNVDQFPEYLEYVERHQPKRRKKE